MTELDKLKQLLNDLMIDYESIGQKTVVLNAKPLFINDCSDGLYLIGCGYSGTWPYSAEFVAKMLDRKFREEAVNNPYLLRMQKESAADERKNVRKNRMRKKGNRRGRSKTSR